MKTMKAFVRTRSSTNQIELANVPIPVISQNEVLVKVKAFGVGIHDRYFIPRNPAFPYVIGAEGSGEIIETGIRVKKVKESDRVIFSSSLLPKGGSWAEYVAVPEESLIAMPVELSYKGGASLPVAGKTAVESIRALDLKRSETLFIAGASGAIGTFVIQLAKKIGVTVISSASGRNQSYMKTLGAAMTVDYNDRGWKDKIKDRFSDGVDAVLAIQPGTANDGLDIVKKNGRIITVSGDQVKSTQNIKVEQFKHQMSLREAFESLLNDITIGKVKVEIENIYAFNDAIKALEKTETRHARGKLVVSMD